MNTATCSKAHDKKWNITIGMNTGEFYGKKGSGIVCLGLLKR